MNETVQAALRSTLENITSERGHLETYLANSRENLAKVEADMLLLTKRQADIEAALAEAGALV